MRELKPSIAMHDVNRPIARAKAEFLNTLAYAFDQASPLRDEMQLPPNSKLTVDTVVVPPKQRISPELELGTNKGGSVIAIGVAKSSHPFESITSNVATLLSIPNLVFQGEFKSAGDASASFLINTTVGVLGLGNPASAMGLSLIHI